MPTILKNINNFTFINTAFILNFKHWPYTSAESPRFLLLLPTEDRIVKERRKLRKHKAQNGLISLDSFYNERNIIFYNSN
jgi:hypothetical protein